MIYSIYQAVNKVNGKTYIGFDSAWPNRQKIHKSSYKKQDYKFYRAIRKHGWDNFEWNLIYQSPDRDHTKNIMEKYFINAYNSFNKGYNSTFGGDGWFGNKHTVETKQIISQKNKIPKPQTREHINKRGKALSKYYSENKITLSEEHKRKISKANKGIPKPMSQSHKNALKCHDNNKTQITCPHCKKSGQLTNMKRWHFANCKLIPKV